MCDKTQINKITSQMVKAYRDIYGQSIKNIVMYGSFARGDFDDESDIDFAAIVVGERQELQKKLEKVWDKASDIGLEHDAVVSPVVIPYEEFLEYKDKLPYYRNIDKEGIIVGWLSAIQNRCSKRKYSKYLSSAFQIRNSCDYDDFYIVSKANAEEQYRKVDEMIRVIIDYLCKSEEL